MWPSAVLSGVAHTRIGTDPDEPSRHSKSPTAMATRYEDIFGLSANLSVCRPAPGPGVSDSSRPFEIAESFASIVSASENVAFSAGSSKHGNARRASVASNCVMA